MAFSLLSYVQTFVFPCTACYTSMDGFNLQIAIHTLLFEKRQHARMAYCDRGKIIKFYSFANIAEIGVKIGIFEATESIPGLCFTYK